MTAAALLRTLTQRGVRLQAHGPDLVVDGPADALPDDVIVRLRSLKSDLLGLLISAQRGELWNAEDWQAYFEERAAIREHDGGLPVRGAERLALEDAVTHWLCLNPAPASDPRHGCVHCGLDNEPGNTLLPVLAPGGHVWVHDRCWETWRAARRHTAQKALRRLGVPVALGSRRRLD